MGTRLKMVAEGSFKPDGWSNGDGGYQGSEGGGWWVYQLPDGQLVKINYATNSYDSDQQIKSVELVQGKEKKVVVYE